MVAADIGQIVALLIAGAGLFLSAVQIARQRREQRMRQVIHLQERLYGDPDIEQMYRRLERGWEYPVYPVDSADTAAHDRLEEHLDKLLGLFDMAARVYQLGIIKIEELELIAYEYLTVHQNPGVQRYLHLVAESNRARGMRIEPVRAFREAGDTLQERYHYTPVPSHWRSPPDRP